MENNRYQLYTISNINNIHIIECYKRQNEGQNDKIYFKIKYLFLCLILFSIFSGAYEFKPPKDRNHYLDCNGCPNWKDEIKKFNENNNYILKIWPYPKKGISLN